jgi:hypothetical protein
VVVAHLEADGVPDPSLPGVAPPAEVTFTAQIDPTTLRLVASRSGTVAAVDLIPEPLGWSTFQGLSLGPDPAGPRRTCEGLGQIFLSRLDIVVDGEGIRGTCRGGVEWFTGGVSTGVLAKGTFTGTPDHVPPGLLPLPVESHPADLLQVAFSEALPASTVASLVDPAGKIIPLPPDPRSAGEPVASFFAGRYLWPGTKYRLVIEPELMDLAGNRAPQPPTIDTVAVPLLPEDGFEGATLPYLTGPAAVVGADRYPPISGQRSLYVPPHGYQESSADWRVSMRLAVKPGAKVVRATVRAVLPSENTDVVSVRLFAISPTGKLAVLLVGTALPPLTRIEAAGVWLSAPQAIALTLPEGAVEDVLLDMRRDDNCGRPPRPSVGALLDDLRVE